jgi:drug/metabolite transporter (DMT)-like permease
MKQLLTAFNRTPPWFQLTVGAVLISFSGVYVKIAHVSPVVAGFYRMLFGGIVLLVLVLLRRELRFRGWGYLAVGLFCSFWLAVDLTLWHYSIHMIGPGLATILANFQVFFMALAGVLLLGEKLNLKLVVSIPLALFGLFLVVGVQWERLSGGYRFGVYAGLTAAICYTLFLLSLRKIQQMENPLSTAATLTYVSFLTAAFVALDVWYQGDSFRIPDVQSYLSLGAYGITSQVAGWLIITRALPKLRASLVGMILLLQPALAFVWDVLFFNRETTLVGLVGIAITLAAIYLGVTAKASTPGRP